MPSISDLFANIAPTPSPASVGSYSPSFSGPNALQPAGSGSPGGAPLSLGNVHFYSGFDGLPESISHGGKQMLTTHTKIGGGRVVDANGVDLDDISWSGTLLGQDADTRSRALEAMRDAGDMVTLAWGAYDFDVVIESYKAASSFMHVEYSINVRVLDTHPVTSAPTVDQSVAADIGSAQGIGLPTGLQSLRGALGGLSGLQGQATSLIGSDPSTAAFLGSLTATQLGVNVVVASSAAGLGSLGRIGDVTDTPFATTTKLQQASALLETMAVGGVLGAYLGSALNRTQGG